MKFEFSGRVFEWRGPAPFYFIALPLEIAEDIKLQSAGLTYGWGVIPATVEILNRQTTTSLIPRDGGYYLPVKQDLRIPLKIEVGQEVSVLLTI